MPNADAEPPDDEPPRLSPAAIVKQPTGVEGFDALTGGGLPRHRLTVVVGNTGSGKTIFAMQTVAAHLAQGERCIFVAFEEPADRVIGNIAGFTWGGSLSTAPGFRLVEARMPLDTIIGGAFDLGALLARLTVMTQELGATFIVFDAIDALLAGLRDDWLERQELARIDEWIRRMGLSAILTVKAYGSGERDQRRAELLQYMADCVVGLSRILTSTESSRTLCIEKYRGADFVANPAPLVISAAGIEVIVITGARSDHPTSSERLSSGIPRLDAIIDGGYRRGSSVLVSGSPGTSKTTLGVSFVAAACARGDRALFVSFDENGAQIVENVRSVGFDLSAWIDSGLLRIASFISTGRSPEEHFLRVRALIADHRPDCLVVDPISSLLKSGYPFSRAICEAMLDYAKSLGITVLCTSLLDQAAGDVEMSASHVSTIADTWLHVSYVARDGERNRAITIIKSRGTRHSNQVRELVIGPAGVDLVDVYIAEGEVLMGSARAQKEAQAARLQSLHEAETRLKRMELDAEVADLTQKVATATLALQAKQREAEFVELVARQDAESLEQAIGARRHLRRTGAEARPLDPGEPQVRRETARHGA
jgi:circadian clock protein KaiC